MSTDPICPCDDTSNAPPTNLPGLSHIAFRVGTFSQFRRALLTPLAGETELSTAAGPAVPGAPPASVWRPGAEGDLAVMLVEWWAYVADILTFYNERIANQSYLRTADLPESVPRLIRLLGYRPRPAVGATGVLAALVTAGQTATLPAGLQFQSKPGPGQEAQTFELDADTVIGSPDAVRANPPALLLASAPKPPATIHAAAPATRVNARTSLLSNLTIVNLVRSLQTQAALFRFLGSPAPAPVLTTNFNLLLQGTITNIAVGAPLMLAPRDPARGAPLLAIVVRVEAQTASGGAKQTQLTLQIQGSPPDGLTAAEARLAKATQQIGLWSFFTTGVISGTTLQLASLARAIRPGDPVLVTAPDQTPLLTTVVSTTDVIWYANAAPNQPTTPPASQALPVPHTQLVVVDSLARFTSPASVTVSFGFVDVGRLKDQSPAPFFTGAPPSLLAVPPATFISTSAGLPILVADSAGSGMLATGSSSGDGVLSLPSTVPAPVPPLKPPLTVLYNLLPVSRGKTITNEVLGGGDASIAGQSFKLAKAPVTYLMSGSTIVSTIAIRVDGRPWLEVPSFLDQSPTAEVFVTREDEAGETHVDFGDGVNGARLPTGTNNVVATYRVGAGAASPAAGKLTVIAKSFPGLKSVLNPVAVGGGADPDPPALIAKFAPRSVLTFGRAVSVFDYQALAAQAPGVTRARATWSWDDAEQRAVVAVHVGDDAAAFVSATEVLAAAGDPNRPVAVVLAGAIPVALNMTLVVTAGFDETAIIDQVTLALADPANGLFAPTKLDIGETVFNSMIDQAVLAIEGVVAVSALTFSMGNPPVVSPGELHSPGEGNYFAPITVSIVTQAGLHG